MVKLVLHLSVFFSGLLKSSRFPPTLRSVLVLDSQVIQTQVIVRHLSAMKKNIHRKPNQTKHN